MVATYGMGESLGRVAVGGRSGEVFLGRDFTALQNISQATLEAVDGEIRAIIEEAEDEAAAILKANRGIVEAIVQKLLEHETLSGKPLDALLAQVKPARAVSANGARKISGRSKALVLGH